VHVFPVNVRYGRANKAGLVIKNRTILVTDQGR